MDILWRDVPMGGLRPILHILPEYAEKNNQPSLESLPQPRSWARFEQVIAPRIRTLHLDLKTFHENQDSSSLNRTLLQDVFYTAPLRVNMPNLRKLHIKLDLDFLHVEIMSRLSSPAVEHLFLDINIHSGGDTSHTGATTDRPFSLGSLFGFIAAHMPSLLSLRVSLPTADLLFSTWSHFTTALMRLRRLQTLTIPAFALSSALLYSLTKHPSLTNIYACEADCDPVWIDAHTKEEQTLQTRDKKTEDAMSLHLFTDPHPPCVVFGALTHLTLSAPLPELCLLFYRSPHLPRLQSLHVIPPRPLLILEELQAFLEAVANVFPTLRALRLAPLAFSGPGVRIGPTTLNALRALAHLETLVIRTRGPFVLDGWRLVRWPGYEGEENLHV